MLFNFLNNRRPQQSYTVLARYRNGSWFKRFEVSGRTAYDAARSFDQSDDSDYWQRVSGATLVTNEF